MSKEMAIWGNGNDLEDFSFSATVVPFHPPIPLLRGPVPAGSSDDPSAGPFVLAFKDAATWRSAFQATQSKIIDQCQAGARVGCSISASNKCKPPWWKSLFGAAVVDFAERERCEEREMSSCLAASRESCIQFAKEKCLPPFRDARIAFTGSPQLVFCPPENAANASGAKVAELGSVNMHLETFLHSSGHSQVTNYRGSSILENSSIETTRTI